MIKIGERLYNGLIKENPTFVLALGMCPTLAVTTSAMNGLGMGLTTTAVLVLSNLIISLLRKVIPNRVRIPAFIVIVASFVTMAQLLLQAYLPSLNDSLGVYIPLIVVNCIILGRAESYAYHNKPIPSFFDGLGMGLGFSIALTLIGAVRELLGTGEIFGYHIMPEGYVTINIFVLAPGAFFVLAALTAIQNKIKKSMARKGKDTSKIGSGCTDDCSTCGKKGCSHRFYDTEADTQNPNKKTDRIADRKSDIKTDKIGDKKADTKTDVKAEKTAENKADIKTDDKVDAPKDNNADKIKDKTEDKIKDRIKDKPEEKLENNRNGKEDK